MLQMKILSIKISHHKSLNHNMMRMVLTRTMSFFFFFDATPRGRLGNYTNEEDILLCLAWKMISLDASIGTDQPMSTYWALMKEFFDAHNASGYDGSAASLRHRWSMISADC